MIILDQVVLNMFLRSHSWALLCSRQARLKASKHGHYPGPALDEHICECEG
jgi:hypothetical protein